VRIEPSATGHPHIVREIVGFFRSGVPPVTPEQTLAIVAFMEAADESRRQLGREVYLRDIFARATAALPPDLHPHHALAP
jgi:hypothetical protein